MSLLRGLAPMIPDLELEGGPDFEGHLREAMLRRFHFVGIGTAAVWAPVWYFQKGSLLMASVIAAAGICFALAYAARHRIGPVLAAHAGIAAATAAILTAVVMTGGAIGSRASWMLIVPVAAALLFGFRGAAVWGGTVLLAALVLWQLEITGVRLPDLAPEDRMGPGRAIEDVSALVLILLFSLIYAHTQEIVRARLRQANRTLSALSADHQRRAHRLEVLNDVGRILASEQALDQLYRAFHVQVGRVLPRDAFLVALWDEATESIRYPFLADGGVEFEEHREPIGSGPTSRAIVERRTVRVPHEPGGGSAWGDRSRTGGSAIHAPMMKDGRVIGALSVQSYSESYSEEDVRLFEALATQAAVAVENGMLYKRVRDAAAAVQGVLGAIERMVGHMVVVCDLEGRITYAAGTEATHGHAPERLQGEHVALLSRNSPDADTLAPRILEAVARGEPFTEVRTGTRKDGSNFPILISSAPYYGPSGELDGVVTIGSDLTEQMESQRRLMHSAKLASIGELVAGIAHELNNPLMVVKSTAQLIEMEAEGVVAEDARTIREQADRAARIVGGLLQFARQAPRRRTPTDVNEVVERVFRFRREGLSLPGIRTTLRLGGDLPRVDADPTQLEQVVLNLLSNAEQAIASDGGSGEVVVSTECRDDRLLIRVIDDGPGIPPEVLPRVFDPFFTTRPVGEGTGLGLAVSHGIVAEHGGTLRVESRPGAGTAFTAELPAVSDSSPEPGGISEPSPRSPARSVLVVDDEPAVRRVLRRYLEARGHSVDEASTGARALAHLEVREFDRIVLDLRMPGMTGEELFGALRQRRPELARRVIFATGDAVSPAGKQFLEGTGRPVFEKPYDLNRLAEMIESTDAPPESMP